MEPRGLQLVAVGRKSSARGNREIKPRTLPWVAATGLSSTESNAATHGGLESSRIMDCLRRRASGKATGFARICYSRARYLPKLPGLVAKRFRFGRQIKGEDCDA